MSKFSLITKCFTFLAMAIFSLSANAVTWIKLSDVGSDYTFYIDKATDFAQKKNNPEAIILFNFFQPQKVSEGNIKSMVAIERYDCRKNLKYTLRIIAYKGQMGEGEPKSDKTQPEEWKPVNPESITQTLLTGLCQSYLGK